MVPFVWKACVIYISEGGGSLQQHSAHDDRAKMPMREAFMGHCYPSMRSPFTLETCS